MRCQSSRMGQCLCPQVEAEGLDVPGSDLRGWRRACSKQGGQVSMVWLQVFLDSEVVLLVLALLAQELDTPGSTITCRQRAGSRGSNTNGQPSTCVLRDRAVFPWWDGCRKTGPMGRAPAAMATPGSQLNGPAIRSVALGCSALARHVN